MNINNGTHGLPIPIKLSVIDSGQRTERRDSKSRASRHTSLAPEENRIRLGNDDVAELVHYWKEQMTFVERCESEELDELLSAAEEEMEEIRQTITWRVVCLEDGKMRVVDQLTAFSEDRQFT